MCHFLKLVYQRTNDSTSMKFSSRIPFEIFFVVADQIKIKRLYDSKCILTDTDFENIVFQFNLFKNIKAE